MKIILDIMTSTLYYIAAMVETNTQSARGMLVAPLGVASVFLASVVAARGLLATFWLPPPIALLVRYGPLIFLAGYLVAQWRFLRYAEPSERTLFLEALRSVLVTVVAVLILGELFASLGARLWDPLGVWHWVVLLACLLGAHRARSTAKRNKEASS